MLSDTFRGESDELDDEEDDDESLSTVISSPESMVAGAVGCPFKRGSLTALLNGKNVHLYSWYDLAKAF